MNDISIRFMFYIAIFLATLLAVEGAYLFYRDKVGARRRVNKRLELIDRIGDRAEVLGRLRRVQNEISSGPLRPVLMLLSRKVSAAGLRISPFAVLAGMVIGTGIMFALGIASVGRLGATNMMPVVLLLALVAGVWLPIMVLNFLRDRHLKKMAEQFPVALDVFVRGLRAGHPIASALELLTVEMPDPIGSEFGIVVDEVTYGLELRDALQNLADRIGLEDLHMFVVSVSIQGETGGNLAEILENLSRVIRERASMVLKVRALSSEGKMSGIMLSVLPPVAFSLVFFPKPEFYLDVIHEPIFMPSVMALLGLYVTGVWMIRRLIDLKV